MRRPGEPRVDEYHLWCPKKAPENRYAACTTGPNHLALHLLRAEVIPLISPRWPQAMEKPLGTVADMVAPGGAKVVGAPFSSEFTPSLKCRLLQYCDLAKGLHGF